MKKTLVCTAMVALCAGFIHPLSAADEIWDGETDGAWADITNWVGNLGSPGAGDIATFDSAGGAVDTIDLGGAVTIDQIIVDATGGTSYTFGVGADTLTFSDNANDPNFTLTAAADADQTINAGLWLGTDASIGDINFDLDSTTQKLIINGNIDTLSGGTPGVKRLEFGDFNLAEMGSVELNGDILNTGGATRIDHFIAGADLTMSGNVDGTSNTQRTYIRFGSTATVNPGGSLGQGAMSIRHGDLVLNTDLQEFFNGLNFGDPTQGNGPATATVGAANTLLQSSGITYFADNNIANVATLQGGIVQITGAARTVIVNDNTLIDPASPELSITSTLTNDGTNRGLTVRNTNGGTLLLAPSGAGNTFGGVVTVQEGTLQLGDDALSTGGANLTVAARNNAATADGVSATVDLRGSLNTVNNINFGAAGTENIAGINGFMGSIVDSVGGGLLDDANNITYFAGTAGKENGAALLAADVEFDASGQFKNVTIRDGSADTDLTITGELSTVDPLHVLSFNGEGTLGFAGTLSLHDRTIFQNRKTVLGAGASVQGDRETYVRQRNNADASDFEVELDLNGQELVLTDDLFISQTNTTNVAAIASTRITDSAGGGRIRLTGDNDINYQAGAPTPNVTAFLEADLQFEGSNFSFVTNDGASEVDVNVSGVITDDNGGGRNLVKGGAGTLLLSNPANAYNLLQINAGRVIITDVGALGDNDIHVGNNTTDGIVEFQLAADAAVLNANQIRIGDDNAAAGRTGTASVLSNGSGAVTFPNANFFNELRNNATEDRTLTLGGGNAGDNTIAGVIRDNGAGGSVVSVDKTGAGKWILRGINTYTGGTNVLEGRLDIDGSVGGTLTVANGASIGGDGTIASTVTLGVTSLFFDGSTAEALTAQGPIDTSAGVTVFVTANGAGALTVLNYNSGAANNISTAHFTLDGSVATSGRVVGTPPFMDTGSAITIDLGYGNKTWTGFDSNDWIEGSAAEGNWTDGGSGDFLFFNGDFVTFDDTVGVNESIDLVENV
ncbi:MAG: hypothetical protein HKO57_12000, partial [Akkermansiaceae bacterium]|nr:hypothetical protein [Akkermansiaceae bacterium]